MNLHLAPGTAHGLGNLYDAAVAGVPLVVGDGVACSGVDAVDAVVALAEASGARVHEEILGAEVDFPMTHDQWVSHFPPDEDAVAPLLDVHPAVDIPANAESHGGTGRPVESGDGVEPALAAAVAADGPSVVDVLVEE